MMGIQAAASDESSASSTAKDLFTLHVPLPASYCTANWPIVHAAMSVTGDVAVSGRRGLAVYSQRGGRWKLFGDVSQVGLGWA